MSEHVCAIPDELMPDEWYKAACVCIAKPHGHRKPTIFGPREIAFVRVGGSVAALGPCTCECHST